jgi:hypothetical protein
VSPALDLEVEQPARGAFAPGDWVRGRVTVLGGGKSRALTVTLRYRERTDDYSSTAATYEIAPLHVGDLVARARFDYAVQLPADALPGYSSANGELYWEVEARSDELGPDTVTQQRIEVAIRR